MTHDPLCPWAQENVFSHRGECFLIEGSEPPISSCQLIAKVRADEHSHMGIIDLAYEAGVKYAVKAMTDTLNSLTANGQEND